MRPLALKWRLSLLMAAALAAAIAAICAIAYEETGELLRRQIDQSLLAWARASQEVLQDPDSGPAPSARLSSLLAPPGRHAEILARIWREDTGLAIPVAHGLGSEWDSILSTLPKPQAGQSRFFSAAMGRLNYRGVWLRTGQPRPVSFVIASATQRTESELGELLRDLLWIGGAASGLMVVGVVLLVRVGLGPIHAAARHLVGIDARSLARVRLEPREVPAELAPFVESLRQMLERLNDFVRRQKAFIADASHELRTPLTVAKSTIQTTLAADRSAAQYRQSLEEALQDLRRMEHLVDELLLLARLDEAAEAPPNEEVQLDHLLEELAASWGARASQAGGELTCSLRPAVVRGDYDQLVRLFSNLLDNALRHGPKGGTAHLAVEVRSADVLVRVHNNGSIPPEGLPRLFERFYRVDGSRASATGGAGLGLAIARQIVARHGGTIVITSGPARGTQVTVTLPLARAPGLPASPGASRPPAPPG